MTHRFGSAEEARDAALSMGQHIGGSAGIPSKLMGQALASYVSHASSMNHVVDEDDLLVVANVLVHYENLKQGKYKDLYDPAGTT